MHLTLPDALMALEQTRDKLFVNLFSHGTMSIELYSPPGKDLQQAHTKDEIYIIAQGEGEFINDGEKVDFRTGDVLFVPAGVEHHFQHFSEDFCTWVIFFGPEGGEKV